MSIPRPDPVELNRIVGAGLLTTIWVVQLVIYPAFHSIDAAVFRSWHAGYNATITWVVAPLILLQAGLAVWLWFAGAAPRGLLVANLLLTAVAWGVTFGISVPCHEALQRELSSAVIDRLVQTNWIRTAAWTLTFLISLLLRRPGVENSQRFAS
jgi:hypothetical protein